MSRNMTPEYWLLKFPNLALPVPVGILSGLLRVTPEWLSLAATLVREAVPIVVGGALEDEAGLEAGG